MKKFTVSEDTEVVLNGKKFLLEKGDKIIINEDVSLEQELEHYFGGRWVIGNHNNPGQIQRIDSYEDHTAPASRVLGTEKMVPTTFQRTFTMHLDPDTGEFVLDRDSSELVEEGLPNYAEKLNELPRLRGKVIQAIEEKDKKSAESKELKRAEQEQKSQEPIEDEGYW